MDTYLSMADEKPMADATSMARAISSVQVRSKMHHKHHMCMGNIVILPACCSASSTAQAEFL